ncbi:MAG TPA: c-type cytochrome [Vicinamibacterales bacterium]|nr:c-type cytochrome [Vicinamibacterales bacterium]
MTWRALGVVAGWVIIVGASTYAQAPASKNPFEGDQNAIKSGMGLFRARCADCHGMDARGVRGPDITQVWASGRTDDGLFTTIKNGIAGTEMPAQPRLFEHETWQILAYLKTLAASARPDPQRGNAENGKKIYQANCVGCHRVNGVGGRLGPDLSRIGAARSREVLELRIRGGVEGFLPGYEPVTLTPQEGQAVVGVKKNEDLFSVQVMDTRERIQGYDKAMLKEMQNNPRSAMPPFGSNRISESDLDDLIRYLQTLRGFDPSVVQ